MRLFFVLFVCMPQVAWARPDWVTTPPKSDGEFRYYVGRASRAESEAEGFREAAEDAYAQAIRENFGFLTRVQTESSESEKGLEMSRRSEQVSRRVFLRGMEQVEFYREEPGEGRFDVWALYRYSKVELQKEAARLQREKDVDSNGSFSEWGNASGAAFGTLEVVTDPPGASLLVDGNPIPFIETPIRVRGSLPPGKHVVRLDHPYYEPVEERVVLVPGAVSRVKRTLKRAKGALSVTSLPEGAVVRVNGKKLGRTPLSWKSFLAGERLYLEVSHTDTERYLQEVVLERDERREVSVTLTLKPGLVSLATQPSGARILLQQEGEVVRELSSPTGWVSLSPGKYKLTAEREGFAPLQKSFELKGGQRLSLHGLRFPRPGKVSLSTTPEPASVRFVGKHSELTFASPLEGALVPPGKYQLEVTAEGHQGEHREIEVREGQPLKLSPIYLLPEPEDTGPSALGTFLGSLMEGAEQPSLGLGLGIFFQSGTFQGLDETLWGLGLLVHARPTWWLGVEVEGAYRGGVSDGYFSTSPSHSALGLRLAALWFPSREAGVFLSPEYLSFSTDYEGSIGLERRYQVQVDQKGWGLSVGYLWWDGGRSGGLRYSLFVRGGIQLWKSAQGTPGATAGYFCFGLGMGR